MKATKINIKEFLKKESEYKKLTNKRDKLNTDFYNLSKN